MAKKLEVHREQIEIPEGRTMNIYTFSLDGEPMQEMRKEDIVATTKPEPTDKPSSAS